MRLEVRAGLLLVIGRRRYSILRETGCFYCIHASGKSQIKKPEFRRKLRQGNRVAAKTTFIDRAKSRDQAKETGPRGEMSRGRRLLSRAKKSASSPDFHSAERRFRSI
jgi:hypothetical protein